MLFHGMSGTGKTMMANALANHLGKKVLLANFPTARSMAGGGAMAIELLKYVCVYVCVCVCVCVC